MIHARIDLVIMGHRRAYEAGPEAMGVWLFAVGYAREQETDGFVPSAILHSAWGGRSNAKLAARLVSAGLLVVVSGGYMVQKYAEKNETKAQIDVRRQAEAARKAAYRDRGTRGGVPAGHAPMSQRDTVGTPAGVRDTEPEPEPEPEPDLRDPEGEHAAPKPGQLVPLGAGLGEAPPVKPAKAARGSRLPEGWSPSEATLAALRAEGITAPAEALPSFGDYWRAVPGQRGVKLDWEGTYRNWVRRDATRAPGPGGGPQRPGPGGRLIQVPLPEQADRFDFSEEANDRRRVERERRNAGM